MIEYATRRGKRLARTNWQDADDIAQEAILASFANGGLSDGIRLAMTDIKFRASNAARAKSMDSASTSIGDWDAPCGAQAPDHIFWKMLDKAESSMPEDMALVYRLVYLADYTNKEAAKEIGKSASWVNQKKSKLDIFLREFFGQEVKAKQVELISMKHDGGETFSGTRKDFCEKYGVDRRKLSSVITGSYTSYKGWRMDEQEVSRDHY